MTLALALIDLSDEEPSSQNPIPQLKISIEPVKSNTGTIPKQSNFISNTNDVQRQQIVNSETNAPGNHTRRPYLQQFLPNATPFAIRAENAQINKAKIIPANSNGNRQYSRTAYEAIEQHKLQRLNGRNSVPTVHSQPSVGDHLHRKSTGFFSKNRFSPQFTSSKQEMGDSKNVPPEDSILRGYAEEIRSLKEACLLMAERMAQQDRENGITGRDSERGGNIST